jgi:hypothetical protein
MKIVRRKFKSKYTNGGETFYALVSSDMIGNNSCRLYEERQQLESEVTEMKANLNELSTELRIIIR